MAARALLGWAAFTLVYAAFDYFFTDRGRSFLSLLPGAAVAGVLALAFFALFAGFTFRRRRPATTGTTDQRTPSDGEAGGSRND